MRRVCNVCLKPTNRRGPEDRTTVMVRPVFNGGYRATSQPIRDPLDRGPGEPGDPQDLRLPRAGVRGGVTGM